MVIPLNDCDYITYPTSKLISLKNRYYKLKDINGCLDEAKKEISKDFTNVDIQKIIFDKLDKWLKVVYNGKL